MSEHFPAIRYATVAALKSGPDADRKLTKNAYIQFHDKDTRNHVLNELRSKSVKVVNGAGSEVKSDRMRLKSQSRRWYFLQRAREVVEKQYQGKSVKIEIS